MDQRTFSLLYMSYLEHGIRRYEMGQPIVTDDLFFRLCRALERHWHSYTHPLKHLADEGDLRAGCGFRPIHKPELQPYRDMIQHCGQTSILNSWRKPQ